jgi:hypothetical protein
MTKRINPTEEEQENFRLKMHETLAKSIENSLMSGAIKEVKRDLNTLAVTILTKKHETANGLMTSYETLINEIVHICSTPLGDEKLDLARAKLALDTLKMFVPPPAAEKEEDKQTYTLVLNESDIKVQRSLDTETTDEPAADNPARPATDNNTKPV